VVKALQDVDTELVSFLGEITPVKADAGRRYMSAVLKALEKDRRRRLSWDDFLGLMSVALPQRVHSPADFDRADPPAAPRESKEAFEPALPKMSVVPSMRPCTPSKSGRPVSRDSARVIHQEATRLGGALSIVTASATADSSTLHFSAYEPETSTTYKAKLDSDDVTCVLGHPVALTLENAPRVAAEVVTKLTLSRPLLSKTLAFLDERRSPRSVLHQRAVRLGSRYLIVRVCTAKDENQFNLVTYDPATGEDKSRMMDVEGASKMSQPAIISWCQSLIDDGLLY
jgi:hypothetical protein